MKKLLNMLLVICIIIITCQNVMAAEKTGTVNSNVQDSKLREELREKLLEEYANDKEFQNYMEIAPEDAAAYIECLVEDLISTMNEAEINSSSNGIEAFCTVPVKTQSTSNNCSAATILQTLYGLGKQGSVVGSTDSAKQSTIFNNYTTNTTAPGARNPKSTNTTLTVLEVTTYLNRFVSAHVYKSTMGTNLSEGSFKSIIWNSLVHNRPVLLHAKTQYFKYYSGHESGHYLSLDWYSKENGNVRIKDCNYNSKYNGSHIVSWREAYNSIKKTSGRYIIAGQ